MSCGSSTACLQDDNSLLPSWTGAQLGGLTSPSVALIKNVIMDKAGSVDQFRDLCQAPVLWHNIPAGTFEEAHNQQARQKALLQIKRSCLQPAGTGNCGLRMSPHAAHHHWCLTKSETTADIQSEEQAAPSMLQSRAAGSKLTIGA